METLVSEMAEIAAASKLQRDIRKKITVGTGYDDFNSQHLLKNICGIEIYTSLAEMETTKNSISNKVNKETKLATLNQYQLLTAKRRN